MKLCIILSLLDCMILIIDETKNNLSLFDLKMENETIFLIINLRGIQNCSHVQNIMVFRIRTYFNSIIHISIILDILS